MARGTDAYGVQHCCPSLPIIINARVLQFGQGYLTPNNPNTVPSIVKYGYSADNLEFTETGFAEVMLTHLPAGF